MPEASSNKKTETNETTDTAEATSYKIGTGKQETDPGPNGVLHSIILPVILNHKDHPH